MMTWRIGEGGMERFFTQTMVGSKNGEYQLIPHGSYSPYLSPYFPSSKAFLLNP